MTEPGDVTEVAAATGYSRRTVQAMVARGKIPAPTGCATAADGCSI